MALGSRSAIAFAVVVVAFVACLPTREEGDTRRLYDRSDAGEADGFVTQDGGVPPATDSGPPDDPSQLFGVEPSHGRFVGGQRVVVSAASYAAKPRIFFGDAEVPTSDVQPVSKTKVQVIVPPGKAGDVDVAAQIGDDTSTRRALPKGYTYDAFYADPSVGPTAGEYTLALHGDGTHWSKGAAPTVKLGGKDCTGVTVLSDVELTCATPPGTPGSKPLTVTTSDGVSETVQDAFTYADSEDGFKGGLSGAPLAGKLKVLAFDSYTGTPLAGARVFVGETTKGVSGVVGAAGVAVLEDPSLAGAVTVTIAMKCMQPQSFVAVPVDTVTAYLDPVLSPDCIPPDEGSPPPVGGKAGPSSVINGQVVFEGGPEFGKSPWVGVPSPKGDKERKVAYVFFASTDPRARFQLPPASAAITEDASGGVGYGFALSAPIGNLAAYALAGIEDRSVDPPKFTAYVFGVTKGIATKPSGTVDDVVITLDHTLDQQVVVHVEPPKPGKNGPDRVRTSVALTLGNYGYAVFPNAQRSTLLPLDQDLTFVGLPAVSGTLAGLTYMTSAQAETGPSGLLPTSTVARVATTSASQVVWLDGFLAVPELAAPKAGVLWDGSSFDVALAPGGAGPDLFVLDVSSGGGLVDWIVVSPGTVPTFKLPDLRPLPKAGLVPGALTVQVSAARILTTDAASGGKFDYGKLQYRHLSTRGWSAYARDVFPAVLPP